MAGGKGASLARMAAAGLPVPRGFVVCTSAFQSFLETHGGTRLVLELTGDLDVHDSAALDGVANRLRALITGSPLPKDLREALAQAYDDLGRQPAVAVRSSAVSEDGDAASFAGQQDTFLNVRGEEAVARQVQACWASFFGSRAMFYRAKKGRALGHADGGRRPGNGPRGQERRAVHGRSHPKASRSDGDRSGVRAG